MPGDTSPVTSTLNHLSKVAVGALSVGAINYLAVRAFTWIRTPAVPTDPGAALLCGLVSSAAHQLFVNRHSNKESKVVGLALAALGPFAACSRLGLPMSFKLSLWHSTLSFALSWIINSNSGKK